MTQVGYRDSVQILRDTVSADEKTGCSVLLPGNSIGCSSRQKRHAVW